MKVDLYVKLANCLEKAARKIKKRIQEQKLQEFISTYELIDSKPTAKKDIRYNPYEGTNLYLVDELIKSEVIKTSDIIQDIGCGVGIVLIYLHSRGFYNVHGVEMDANLYEMCMLNISKYCLATEQKDSFEIINDNAINIEIDDDITFFYIFNTFYDKETYSLWLDNVEKSLKRKNRKITIALLYPTVASMGAMRERSWLYEDKRVLCKAQKCYQCMNYIIYRST